MWSGITHPDGSEERYEHDPFGQLTAITDGLGRTTRYALDGAGRIAEIAAPDGSRTRIGYDEVSGEPAEITDALGNSRRLRYDGRGWPCRRKADGMKCEAWTSWRNV